MTETETASAPKPQNESGPQMTVIKGNENAPGSTPEQRADTKSGFTLVKPEGPTSAETTEGNKPNFDFGPTLKLIENNNTLLSPHIQKELNTKAKAETKIPPHVSIEITEDGGLNKEAVEMVLKLFPQEALNRMIKTKIKTFPDSLYFAKTSEKGKPTFTKKVEEAQSPTSFIPALTEWSLEGKDFASTIHLLKIPDNLKIEGLEKISSDTKTMVMILSLIHEVSHTMTDTIANPGTKLKFNGQVMEGRDILRKFAELASKKDGISAYSNQYRNTDKTFVKDPDDEKIEFRAISEEIAECIKAYMSGVTFVKDSKRIVDPFGDRPEIKSFVESFLKAEKVDGAAAPKIEEKKAA